MGEQHKIELAFSRSRFAAIIGAAVVTGLGLLATGLFAGIEMGSAQAHAAIPPAPQEAPTSLPLQYTHQLPLIEPTESPSAAGAAYMVQAASFRERGEAAMLTDDLTQRGYAAGIFDFTDDAGRSWSIVRVGPYADRDEASQAASELGRISRSEPIVRVGEN